MTTSTNSGAAPATPISGHYAYWLGLLATAITFALNALHSLPDKTPKITLACTILIAVLGFLQASGIKVVSSAIEQAKIQPSPVQAAVNDAHVAENSRLAAENAAIKAELAALKGQVVTAAPSTPAPAPEPTPAPASATSSEPPVPSTAPTTT